MWFQTYVRDWLCLGEINIVQSTVRENVNLFQFYYSQRYRRDILENFVLGILQSLHKILHRPVICATAWSTKWILRTYQYLTLKTTFWFQVCSTWTITLISEQKKCKRTKWLKEIDPGLQKQFKSCLWVIEWLMTFTLFVLCSPL